MTQIRASIFYLFLKNMDIWDLFCDSDQLDGLAERLSQLPPSVSAAPIFKQMEKIEDAKNKSGGTIKRGQKT